MRRNNPLADAADATGEFFGIVFLCFVLAIVVTILSIFLESNSFWEIFTKLIPSLFKFCVG